jgi:hypothetical protein
MQENEIILALKQMQEVLLHNPKDLEAQIKCANIWKRSYVACTIYAN